MASLKELRSETEIMAQQSARLDAQKTWSIVFVITGVIVFLTILGAGALIVAQFFEDPPNTFVAKKSVVIPPKIIEQRMASAEFEAAAPKPVMNDTMSSLRPTDFALPDLPKMPIDQIVPMDPSTLVTDAVTSVMGQEGLGAGRGSGTGGGGGTLSGISFFGMKSQGKSVVIIFDISKSVTSKAEKAGVPITKIKEEAIKMVDGLSINLSFNLVQFSRFYQPVNNGLMSPTDKNKELTKQWLEKEFRTDGQLPRNMKNVKTTASGEDNGIVFVLKGVFAMNPDIIYLISDGSFQSEANPSQVPWDQVEEAIKKHNAARVSPTAINFIGFEMKEDDKKELKRIIKKTGGSVKEIGKD